MKNMPSVGRHVDIRKIDKIGIQMAPNVCLNAIMNSDVIKLK